MSAVSEAHFARSFKEAFGTAPHRYMLTRRGNGWKMLEARA